MILPRKRLSFLILTFLSILFLHNCLVGQKNFLENISYISKEVFKSKVEESMAEWKNWTPHFNRTKSNGDLQYVQFTMKQFIWNYPCLVCLSTQTTVNRFLEMEQVVKNWKGRMSVSVFIPGLEFTRAKIVLWLFVHCFHFSSQLTIYFAFPSNSLPVDDASMWEGISLKSCKQVPTIGDLLAVTKEFVSYPQNAMRNIARDECNGEYVILSDNDMIPTPGLSTALQPLLTQQRACEKCAFVISVYEIEENVTTLPDNKSQLIVMLKEKLARPFHWSYFKLNQGSHNPKRWERVRNSNGIQIAYPILTYRLGYEPIYVAKVPLPAFDNRFVGYGYVRNTQMFEMVAAGYKFYLLDNTFLMHRGMGMNKYSPRTREKEKARNSRKFENFIREVLVRYGRQDIVDKMNTSSDTRISSYAQNIYDKTPLS